MFVENLLKDSKVFNVMSSFHSLKVEDVRRETADTVSFGLSVPADLSEAFRFQAGQYLLLRTWIDGVDVRRPYSICTSPSEGVLRVAIKAVSDGVFSRFVNDRLLPGDRLDVMPPRGRFVLKHATSGAVYVALACGSGITPVFSILKMVLQTQPTARFILLYGNRTSRSILFKEELCDLKDRFLGRLSVTHILSSEQRDVGVHNGRLDGAKIQALLPQLVPISSISSAFICGPSGMPDEAETALIDLGLARERISVERFTIAHNNTPKKPVHMAASGPAALVATAVIIWDGVTAEVPIGPGQSIIEAALEAGLALPYACRSGMCCTCRARLLEGKTPMDHNYSLEPWEIERGYILTCQAKPITSRIVVDFDQL
jgi:ring-1,2-phenylacetyl-CoA epoxidase subunit PaaE